MMIIAQITAGVTAEGGAGGTFTTGGGAGGAGCTVICGGAAGGAGGAGSAMVVKLASDHELMLVSMPLPLFTALTLQ